MKSKLNSPFSEWGVKTYAQWLGNDDIDWKSFIDTMINNRPVKPSYIAKFVAYSSTVENCPDAHIPHFIRRCSDGYIIHPTIRMKASHLDAQIRANNWKGATLLYASLFNHMKSSEQKEIAEYLSETKKSNMFDQKPLMGSVCKKKEKSNMNPL